MDKNILRCKWSKRENDLMIYYPRSCDGHLLNNLIDSKPIRIKYNRKYNASTLLDFIEFDISFKEALEKRGYDITTLKFECKLKEAIHV